MVSSFRPSPTSLAPWEQAPSSSDFGATSVAHPPPGPALGGASVSDFFGNGFGNSNRTGHPLRPLAGEVFASEVAAEDLHGHLIAAHLATASSSSRSPSGSSACSNEVPRARQVSLPTRPHATSPAVEVVKEVNSDRDTSSEGLHLAEREPEVESERLGPEQHPEILWKEIMRQREEILELQVQLNNKDEELRHCRTGTKISATTSNFLI